jgi:hypothetical protein
MALTKLGVYLAFFRLSNNDGRYGTMPPGNLRRNTFFCGRVRGRTALQRNSKNGLKLRVIRKSRSFVFLPELAQNGTLFDRMLLVTIVAFFWPSRVFA